MRICSIRGCERQHNARGFCGSHYAMLIKHGDPLYADKGLHVSSIGAPGNTVEDFWRHVDRTNNSNDCWEWKLSKDNDGYGFFWHKNVQWRAHRFIAFYVMGLEIENLQVCHKCDNPSCVKPSHLFVGTAIDNSLDRDNKDRQAKGENCHTHVLTEPEVIEIRKLGKEKRLTHREIGLRFNVSRPQIGHILRGESWKHLL